MFLRERPLLVVTLLGGVAVAAGLVVGVLVWGGGDPVMHGRLSAAYCSDEINVFLQSDEEMLATAARLREDPLVESLKTETKAQAYERFKEIFKDQPELVGSVRPESMPAAVHVRPREGTDGHDLKAHLASTYPAAQVEGRPC